MAEESQALDHYAIVLADLRAKREQIDQAIQALESLRGAPAAPARLAAMELSVDASIDTPGAFLGMTIADAAKKLLAARRKVTGNVEMAAAFKSGGLALSSVDPVNTIGAVLSRRAQNTGDIVKMGRGQWGLAEWYPGRNFKKKATKEATEGAATTINGQPTSLGPNPQPNAFSAADPDPWSPLDDAIGRTEMEQ